VLLLFLLTVTPSMVAAKSTSGPSGSPPPAEDEYAVPADYKPYVPVAKRRAQLVQQLGKHQAKRVKTTEEIEQEASERRTAEEEAERAREKARRERTLLQAAQEVKEKKALEGEWGLVA
jgi:ATP-dependent RNA helicase DDX41